MKRVYYIQVIDPNGGEYGAERIPVPVNRRYYIENFDGVHHVPEMWRQDYPPKLFGHISQQPIPSSGEFEGFGWIKEPFTS